MRGIRVFVCFASVAVVVRVVCLQRTLLLEHHRHLVRQRPFVSHDRRWRQFPGHPVVGDSFGSPASSSTLRTAQIRQCDQKLHR